MAKLKLSKEMEDNIRNYGDLITTMESFVEMVRRRPGMFIGDVGNKGFINMIREVLQNSIDELVRSMSPCDFISLSYDERTHTVINEDNGRGIPFDDIIRIFSKEWTGSNYEKQEGDFSAGMHGVGSKASNALSAEFAVESYILGESKKLIFTDGVPGKLEDLGPTNKQGTRITFRPFYGVLGEITVLAIDIYDLIMGILPLTPIGSTLQFNYIKMNNSAHSETIVNTDGIVTNLIMKTETPIIAPILVSKYTGTMTCDIAFTYDAESMDGKEDISLFSNFCPNTEGTHLDGFLDATYKFFKDYMNKIYLSPTSKLTITNSDVKTGLKGIVAVKHLDPVFDSQAKNVLKNKDMQVFVRETLLAGLEDWSRSNPGDLQKICKYLKEIAEIRIKSDQGKVKLAKSYEASSITGLPKKYVKPSGKDKLELWIPEGDSALGMCKLGRCHRRQGLFPIRGKIPNAFTTEKIKFLSNEEISGIIEIIGGGYGKNFDIKKVKWEKLVFMADADPDGAHIRTLLLSFILLYMPELITHGRVFAAVPPLYGVKTKGGKYSYYTNKIDFITTIQKIFSKNNVLSIKGKQLSNNEVLELLYKNIDYLYEMDLLSTRYAIEPKLLELGLVYRNDFKKSKTIIEKAYRFVGVTQINKQTFIKGLINSKVNTLPMNDKILNDAAEIIRYIDEVNQKQISYEINGEACSLYDIMYLFNKSTPSAMTRYKGLGEMNSDQLSDSCLHPDGERTLHQYTVEDIKAEIEAIRVIQSDKSVLMKNLNVSRHDID